MAATNNRRVWLMSSIDTSDNRNEGLHTRTVKAVLVAGHPRRTDRRTDGTTGIAIPLDTPDRSSPRVLSPVCRRFADSPRPLAPSRPSRVGFDCEARSIRTPTDLLYQLVTISLPGDPPPRSYFVFPLPPPPLLPRASSSTGCLGLTAVICLLRRYSPSYLSLFG